MTKGIKQKYPDTCLACVAAMATNTTVLAFEVFLLLRYPNKEIVPPYHDRYFIEYLLTFNLVVGVGLGNIEKDVVGEYVGSTIYHISSSPAVVCVRFEGKEIEHALYWDGNQIWDPDPNTEDGKDLCHYKISGWFPITKMKEC